ncbi:hypothetical protein B0H21DRAFT_732871 [Amylocystis lapponica]|nr:hypothetical protein B0H21DRAFT_732871 [Amylocystis lapponica]
MLRRPPTLIAMTDTDVQQVRDVVAERKAQATAAKHAAYKGNLGAQLQPTSESQLQPQPFVAAEDAKRKREAMTRDERLGLQ